MSDAQALGLLIVLMLAAVVAIHWAWVTRAADGPYVNTFISPSDARRAEQ